MAISTNPLLKNLRGHVNKQVVFRQVGERTILSMYPDMTGIVPSEAQKQQRISFRKAQAKAVEMLKDPRLKAHYKSRCTGKQRPHNILTAELIRGVIKP